MSRMRTAGAVLEVAGALLAAFGWWGQETAAGLRRFDEMAGIIPFAAGVLGALLLVAGIALDVAAARKRGR
ncbi:MAG TPA: hypothetical protein VM890_16065 [Longimicrobium sp.]|jgi:drug/metabolite transporter (DMT)-like permease|nr:hypothetical protein [Longimicrobium sp.]